MNHRDAWALLEVYLDGALAGHTRWAVTAHLAECPVCLKYVASQARVRGKVRDHLVAIQPTPGFGGRLRSALAEEAAGAPKRMALPWSPSTATRIASVLGPALVGLWLLVRVSTPAAETAPDVHAELAIAHALFARDETLLDVTGDAPTVASWFRDEGGLVVSAPELDGYDLSGGRLTILDGKPVAQLVYESEPGDEYLSMVRFKDYRSDGARGDEPDDGFAVGKQGAISTVTWSEGEDRAAIVAALPESELHRLAEDLASGGEPTRSPVS